MEKIIPGLGYYFMIGIITANLSSYNEISAVTDEPYKLQTDICFRFYRHGHRSN